MQNEEMVKAAGGVVYCRDAAGQVQVALILDKHNNWGLPKGHLDEGEDEQTAAQREIEEEIGMRCDLGPWVQRIEYPVTKKGSTFMKSVDYFLVQAACEPLTPRLEEGISQARWFAPADALNTVTFERVREVLQQGLDMLAAGAGGTARA
jgi:8-oxo-dGTP diphosphatase